MMAKDTRWNTAVHEAGHVVVGRHYGARGLHATITTDSRGRTRGGTTPCDWSGTELEEAVYLLAGAAAGRLITGDAALCGSSDRADARRALARTDHTLRVAERQAARMVRQHRRQIRQAAERLYTTGRL